jgi:N-acetyl-alpha-D-muramate 1-phosphate uridylyltransferase
MSPAAPPRALILAAGRGERTRPLTDPCPKPLLPIAGQPLIVHHLQALAQAGVREVVINTAWLEAQFPATLGDGSRWGLRLHYSMEGQAWGGALETAGGIATALPWLAPTGTEPFWVVSGDIWCPDFRFDATQAERFAASDDDAWLWVVPNPGFNTRGDFALQGERLTRTEPRPWTYANLALCRPRLVDGVAPGTRAALGPLLFASAERGRLGGQVLSGRWENVGTPAQLAALQAISAPAPG